ncbi:GTP cyclohydrolase II RibA [Kitasatospora sp. NPDC085895]|uniref:GTP cyclohydrolase II RibA n=1 Tax=Kitasatospora sp. NPDC085895 TaxID=3155057 RepID=UPI00344B88BE
MTIVASTVLDIAEHSLKVSVHETSAGTCLSIGRLKDVSGTPPLVRIHSSCLFGEALGSSDCDCKQQLTSALDLIGKDGHGVVVYLYQEGRGLGIAGKTEAMELQRTEGINTYEAFARLGHEPDPRDYTAAMEALDDLGITGEARLISNNPNKRRELERHGIRATELVPLEYEVDVKARDYLFTKREQGNHRIDLDRITFTGALRKTRQSA